VFQYLPSNYRRYFRGYLRVVCALRNLVERLDGLDQ